MEGYMGEDGLTPNVNQDTQQGPIKALLKLA